jgi:hypothetical protein
MMLSASVALLCRRSSFLAFCSAAFLLDLSLSIESACLSFVILLGFHALNTTTTPS